jgi:hypothetical protein
MRLFLLVGVGGLTALAACGGGGEQVRIDCGTTDVILSEEQSVEMIGKSGGRATAADICAVANVIDISGISGPTPFDVTMPSGQTYSVTLAPSAN